VKNVLNLTTIQQEKEDPEKENQNIKQKKDNWLSTETDHFLP
jgi:hypothetical protein